MASSAETAKVTPVGPKKCRKIKNIFLRKSAIFESLIRETAKRHGVLHVRANLVAKGVLGHMRQIHPISTCTEGKSAKFFEVWVSPGTNAGLCADSPPEYQWRPPDSQNTPGTPAMDFPLGASGSQSALYRGVSGGDQGQKPP